MREVFSGMPGQFAEESVRLTSTGGDGVAGQTIHSSDKDEGDRDENMPEDSRTASDRRRPRAQGRMDTD
jgi:hypothetical protein